MKVAMQYFTERTSVKSLLGSIAKSGLRQQTLNTELYLGKET